MNAEVDEFPAVVGWKHIYLGIHTETGDCDCSLKEPWSAGNTSTSAFIRKPETATAV
jgi:hypothetical protein